MADSRENSSDIMQASAIRRLDTKDDYVILEVDKSFFAKRGLIKKSGIRKPGLKPGTRRKLTFFLDIDSTITDEYSDLPDPRCKPIFVKMRKYGHRIHFISGRPKEKVSSVIKICGVQSNAIAENGGLIIKNNRIIEKLGDKDLCDLSYRKLRCKISKLKKAKGVKSKTEVILLTNVKITTIRKWIDKLGLCVQVNASKRFYHLHATGVDKGYGLTHFMIKNDIDYRYAVAIGDSEIDRPMLKKVAHGLLVSNAPEELRQYVNPCDVLKGASFDGVIEAFIKLEPRIEKFIKEHNFLKTFNEKKKKRK